MHGNENGKTKTKEHFRTFDKLKYMGIRQLYFGLEQKKVQKINGRGRRRTSYRNKIDVLFQYKIYHY